ncbi:hypothetical protein ACOSQ3_002661 [Xanthoceras sorbifolium]
MLCPLYDLCPESVDHSLRACPYVFNSWSLCPFFLVLKGMHFVDFFDRIVFLAASFSNEFISQFLVAVWLVWRQRNLFVHSAGKALCDDFWSRAGDLCAEFAKAGASAPVSPFVSGAVKAWLPPITGVFKVNVDATIDSSSSRFGVGVIILAVGRCAECAEVRAILDGFLLAADWGLFPLLMESNALNIVNLCNGLCFF